MPCVPLQIRSWEKLCPCQYNAAITWTTLLCCSLCFLTPHKSLQPNARQVRTWAYRKIHSLRFHCLRQKTAAQRSFPSHQRPHHKTPSKQRRLWKKTPSHRRPAPRPRMKPLWPRPYKTPSKQRRLWKKTPSHRSPTPRPTMKPMRPRSHKTPINQRRLWKKTPSHRFQPDSSSQDENLVASASQDNISTDVIPHLFLPHGTRHDTKHSCFACPEGDTPVVPLPKDRRTSGDLHPAGRSERRYSSDIDRHQLKISRARRRSRPEC